MPSHGLAADASFFFFFFVEEMQIVKSQNYFLKNALGNNTTKEYLIQ
jgi:hypothetical protein